MKRAFTTSSLLLAAALLTAAGCGSSGDLAKPETQRQFGVRMAKMNLWREAMFRFKRAVDIDPANAMAHNNLAVAYEANGDFDSAAKEYREALRLDRSNQHIQKNYSRFVEFTQKAKKRTEPRTAATARPATAPGAATPAAATPVTSTPGSVPTLQPGAMPTPPAATPPAPPVPPTTTTTTTNPPLGGAL